MNKPIYTDFDGVIHEFKDGWNGIVPTNEPIENAKWAIDLLRSKGFEVIVFTTRKERKEVLEWLDKNKIKVDGITNEKGHALAYIDDRGIRFTNWQDIVKYFV